MTINAHTKNVMLKAKLHPVGVPRGGYFVASCSLIAPVILNVTLRVHW